MIKVKISERDLKVQYTIDGLSCDAIANNYNTTFGSNITGDVIEGLVRSYGIQKRNIKREVVVPNYTIETTEAETTTDPSANITGYVNMNSKVQLEETV